MRPRFLPFRRKDPVIFVIAALLCAATLVIYLQQRALRALDRQTALIVQKVAEQTTVDVLQSIRRKFDGPVFDVLGSMRHPKLAVGQLELVAPAFARGLVEYPQVEQFFIWTDVADSPRPGDVLFYGRPGTEHAAAPSAEQAMMGFHLEPALAGLITATARQHAASQNIYAAFAAEIAGTPYDIFLRTFYTDAARTDFFAVLGFTVNLHAVRRDLFPQLVADGLLTNEPSEEAGLAFDVRVHDEQGRLVFGPAAAPLPTVSASRPFDLVFYPAEDIGTRMAARVPDRTWRLTLTQAGGSAPVLIAYTRRQTYWVSSLSVLLICVALGFALQARARAAELGRMQSEFVAHVSHQLKTPVSLLSAVGETIDRVRTRSPEKLDQCLDIIRMETLRLSALVQHILEFASVTDGERSFELEPVPLGPLVRETAESFAAALAPTGYRIEVEELASPVVTADPVALEQAAVNLLDNAVKYSGDSRLVTVRLSTDGSYARIEVIDRGIGIDPKDRPRLFQRFYRGAGGSAHKQGFGLGLSIARQLIAGQGGSIDVESVPGAGSTFRIMLPIPGSDAGRARARAARWFSSTGAASMAGTRPEKESL